METDRWKCVDVFAICPGLFTPATQPDRSTARTVVPENSSSQHPQRTGAARLADPGRPHHHWISPLDH